MTDRNQPRRNRPDDSFIPDPIEFLAERQGRGFSLSEPEKDLDNERLLSSLPLLEEMVAGPGSSGLLASRFIQARRALRSTGHQPATVIDLQAVDDSIEAMLDVGVRINGGEDEE